MMHEQLTDYGQKLMLPFQCTQIV